MESCGWKAAELYEFVKQYNKSDELNIYIDIDDNTLMLRNMALKKLLFKD